MFNFFFNLLDGDLAWFAGELKEGFFFEEDVSDSSGTFEILKELLLLFRVLGLVIDSDTDQFNEPLNEVGEVHSNGEDQYDLIESSNSWDSVKEDTQKGQQANAEQVDAFESLESDVLDWGSVVMNDEREHANSSSHPDLNETVLVTDESGDDDHQVLSHEDNESPPGRVSLVSGNQEAGI